MIDIWGRESRGHADRDVGAGARRGPWGNAVLRDVAAWTLVTASVLSVNSPHPFLTAELAVALTLVMVAGVLSWLWPAAALAVGVGLAQWDGRYYGVVALVAFLGALRTGRIRPLAWSPALAVPAVLVGGMVDGVWPLGALVAEFAASAILPWLLGRNLRQRRQLAAAGWERARHLEREQEMHADRARLRERARIARDMHDSLGHDLSLLALRAAVFEVDPGLDDEQRAKAADLRRSAAVATDRLHEIIGVLRSEGEADADFTGGFDPRAAQDVAAASVPVEPVHQSPADLVARARASGMEVVLETAGRSPNVPALSLAVQRVVREALTNAAKHAPGAAVRVSVDYGSDAAEIRVVNGPPGGRNGQVGAGEGGPASVDDRAASAFRSQHHDPVSSPRAAPGSRMGLIGLDERVRLTGGTFRAGPQGGGFEVVARFAYPRVPLPTTSTARTSAPTSSAVPTPASVSGKDPAR
ncbi:histidine kinase [Embleya sp. NPDC005575]|uniref:histidine kinase n=1 Tax=Embleya sp. NPDC005575 TaxID=3156892 RepID=UPI0033BA6CDD